MSAALDDLCELRPGLKAFAGSLSSPDPLVTEVVLSLARAARDGLPDLYAERAAHLLARHFLDRHAIDAGRSPRSGEIARIGRVEDYLRSHISDPVSLGDLASIAGCSTFHLIRFCKSHLGGTPFPSADAPPNGTRARTVAGYGCKHHQHFSRMWIR